MKLSIVALLGLLALPLLADTWEDPETGIVWKYSVGQGGVSIYSVENAKGTVSIPNLLPGPLGMHGVFQLGAYLFRRNTDITSVKIPNNITSIEVQCFEDCTNLESVTVEGTITGIPDNCFANCSKLSSVTFASPIVSIGDRAFYACGALESFPFSDGLSMIGEEAFRDCSLLKEVTIPKSVQIIEAGAFSGCGSNGETFSLTINVAKENVSIGEFAFSTRRPTRFVSTWVPESDEIFFYDLQAIGIPEGETTLPNTLLRTMVESAGGLRAEQLTTIILPSSLRYAAREAFDIGMGAFKPTIIEAAELHGTIRLPDSITTLKIPDGTKELVSNAYNSNSNDTIGEELDTLITQIIIPEGVEIIRSGAFSYLTSVETFTLPASLKLIEAGSFPNSSPHGFAISCKTQTISVDNQNEWYITINNILYTKNLTQVLYAAPAANIGDCVLPSTVTRIAPEAFRNCQGLTSIVIQEGAKEISFATFYGCNSLRSVSLPAGLKTIQSGSFTGCQSLATINLPDSLETIGWMAFQDCAALKAIEIPSGVKLIEDNAFSGCTSLETLIINEGVETIEAEAFYGCSKVKALHLPVSVSTMPLDAFPPTWNMESLTVARDNPLYFAQNNILYNKDRTEILLVACKGVSGEIVIPEGVTHLDSYLFSRCENLTSIILPASLASMGDAVFAGCANLQKVHFTGKVPEGFSMNTLYGATITYEESYADAWLAAITVQPNKDTYETKATVTVACEPVGSKQLRVRYTIHSDLPKAKVRAVAFQDGVRSFANFVPVRTGDGVPHGEEVSTNEEHTFVWDIASDWKTDLAKVSVEILAQDGNLLPQHLQVIPTLDSQKGMTITLNSISKYVFNALLWEMAEGDPALTLKDGQVFIDDTLVADGDKLPTKYAWTSSASASGWNTAGEVLLNYLYGKLNHRVLDYDERQYVQDVLRKSIEANGLGRLSVKIEEGE